MTDYLFKHAQAGPYEQFAAITVDDGGNGLPITMAFQTGDPSGACGNSMTISQAKHFRDQLSKAIKAAEKAGIRDAGW
jgi:hypothetical protein